MSKYIQVMFLKGVYRINVENNHGLDDLVYDLRLNEYMDDCYKVVSVYDLKGLFDEGVLKKI